MCFKNIFKNIFKNTFIKFIKFIKLFISKIFSCTFNKNRNAINIVHNRLYVKIEIFFLSLYHTFMYYKDNHCCTAF